MGNYEKDDTLKVLAQKVINEEEKLSYIELDKIVFVKLNKIVKSGHVLGRTVLLGERTEFLTGKRFMIEMPKVFYELSDEQKYIVMEHELKHIHTDNEKLVDHDIGEFRHIIDKYGLDWYEVYKYGQNLLKKKIEIEKLEKKLAKEKEKLSKEEKDESI